MYRKIKDGNALPTSFQQIFIEGMLKINRFLINNIPSSTLENLKTVGYLNRNSNF
jgi:hypothetical protein